MQLCGRSIAGIESSNPAQDIDISLLYKLGCLRKLDLSFRRALPGSCVCVCVGGGVCARLIVCDQEISIMKQSRLE